MSTNANSPFRERTIKQVVNELKMLASRRTATREQEFRFAVDANNIILSMSKGDWTEFQKERARCLKTGATASTENEEL